MKPILAVALAICVSPAIAAQPNIVLILCDDLGYSDVGFNGATDIKTPKLDELAKQGTVFSSAYVAHPFCGPSRMGLMTGRYPHSFGAPYNLPETGDGDDDSYSQGVDTNEELISTLLQKSGYFTGAVGKWHMGTKPQYHPNHRGFDDFYGFLGGGHKYFPKKYQAAYQKQLDSGGKRIWDYLTPLQHNGKQVKETEYLTDGLSREAARFVREASQRDQPFFLYLSYNAPHTPLEAKEEDLAEYAGIQDKKRRTYAGMVHAVDRGVGNVVQALQEAGELEDTLIIFLSDNGGKLPAGATNRPLKGGKGDVYEGGFRVPMLFHWPHNVAAGKTYPHPVSALDFYPMFAALAGAAIAEGKQLDGLDIWPALQEGNSARPGEPIFALRHRNGFSDVAVRQDNWKACKAYRQRWQLFNIDEDLGEQHDLSTQHPEKLSELIAKAESWSRTHPDPLWFHALEARDEWKATGMPHYDETFSTENHK